MSYVIAWNNSTPALSELANQTAPYFQNTKLAISERMTGFIVQDWTADPLVLTDTVLGNVATKLMNIHPAQFTWDGTPNIFYNDKNVGDYLVYNQSVVGVHNIFGFCPVDIPVGCTITEFLVSWRGDGSNNSRISLYKQAIGTPLTTPPTLVSTLTYSGNTLNTSTASLSNPVLAGETYYITISLVAFGPSTITAIQAVQLQYSTPDCRSTR